jgi:hypothetical protein
VDAAAVADAVIAARWIWSEVGLDTTGQLRQALSAVDLAALRRLAADDRLAGPVRPRGSAWMCSTAAPSRDLPRPDPCLAEEGIEAPRELGQPVRRDLRIQVMF